VGVYILKPKPRPEPHGPGLPKPVEQLEIQNYTEQDAAGGSVNREGSVLLKTTDDHTERSIRLAVKVLVNQEVRSLKFWNSRRNEMVPDHSSDVVAAAAQAAKPAEVGYPWHGFLVPYDSVPRPFKLKPYARRPRASKPR
jgi:hypothetical protein